VRLCCVLGHGGMAYCVDDGEAYCRSRRGGRRRARPTEGHRLKIRQAADATTLLVGQDSILSSGTGGSPPGGGCRHTPHPHPPPSASWRRGGNRRGPREIRLLEEAKKAERSWVSC
jgi:hypothetical protein